MAGGIVAIGDDVERLSASSPGRCVALYVGGMGAKGRTSTTTWSAATASSRRPSEIQDLYLDGQKEEAAAMVPDELLEATSLCGPEGYVKEPHRRLQREPASPISTSRRSPSATRPPPRCCHIKDWASLRTPSIDAPAAPEGFGSASRWGRRGARAFDAVAERVVDVHLTVAVDPVAVTDVDPGGRQASGELVELVDEQSG